MANDPVNSLIVPVNHNPDVLSCLANLSNDEVFTPPSVANAMLDLLPQELFQNSATKFLDPVCKSGVFLREITKRLMAGLENEFTDPQKRLDHILHNQVYGIAITELTSLLSRRTLYCAKYATSPYAISKFANIDGNIRFKAIQHTWKNGKCVFCGASQSQYEREEGLETHAYEFIHTDNPQEIFKDMKFDVIIGNPPYQLSDGGNAASAIPIYDKFVLSALKLNPTFLSMIIPSRWFVGGKGLDQFREKMLNNNSIKYIQDFTNARECFPTQEIKGGVSYFLIDKNYKGYCTITTHRLNKISTAKRSLLEKNYDVFIRFNEAVPILKKILNKSELRFNTIVSSRKPFGFDTSFRGHEKGEFKLYQQRGFSFIDQNEFIKNFSWANKYKIFISKAYGASEEFPHQILNKPILGNPKTCCTETYLVIGPFNSKKEALNAISYISTKFFRFLVMQRKQSQDATSKVYSFVPLQDFSKPWTDAELYAKYNLSQDEIDFIESMIKPMDLSVEAQDA